MKTNLRPSLLVRFRGKEKEGCIMDSPQVCACKWVDGDVVTQLHRSIEGHCRVLAF